VTDFVGLDCSPISIIANRTAEAWKTPRIKTRPRRILLQAIADDENVAGALGTQRQPTSPQITTEAV